MENLTQELAAKAEGRGGEGGGLEKKEVKTVKVKHRKGFVIESGKEMFISQ